MFLFSFHASSAWFYKLTIEIPLQVVWLKVELCKLLEEKRSAVLRLTFCFFKSTLEYLG